MRESEFGGEFVAVDGFACSGEPGFGFDFPDVFQPEEWEQVCKVFQKRHLLAHKMGVADEEYVQKAKDPGAVLGRKIRVDSDEVTSAMSLIESLGRRLFTGLLSPTTPTP